jgi:uncharacterized membrane protein YfhO
LRALPLAALLLVAGESWANAWAMEVRLDEQFRYRMREEYTAYREKYGPAVEAVATLDTGHYRVEIPEQRSANGGMALGYNGISHYSTTTDQRLNRFLRGLGYNRGTENELRFAPNTPITNGLLGIKYLLTGEHPGGGYDAVGEVNGVTLYENRCALPLAFWAPSGAMKWEAGTDDPFLLQNGLLSALSAGLSAEVFAPVHAGQSLYNVDLERLEGYLELAPRVAGEGAAVEYRVENPLRRELFAYVPVWNERFATAEVFVGEKPVGWNLRYRENSPVALGNGESASLTLELSTNITRIEAEYFYALDLGAAEQLAAELRGQAMEIQTFTDTRVEGVIGAEADGSLVTTFPYDDGWRVYLDGERVRTERFAGVFLAVPLPAGEHRVELRYLPPGFAVGCVVSAGCLGGVLVFWQKKKKHPR